MLRFGRIIYAAFVLLACLRPAAADEVFLLASGGRVEGELVNADESPRTTYVISLANGGHLTLDASVVEKVVPVRPQLAEYEKVRKQYPDTAQGQLELANWCRDHKLSAQRTTALERVLQIQPDEPEARAKLGYHKFKDQWVTQDEEMTDKGYVKRGVTWMSQPEADHYDDVQKQHKAEVEWVMKISRWRKWMEGTRAETGKNNLRAIDDPMAIFGLGEKLKSDQLIEAKVIYIEVLGRLNHAAARAVLAMCAIDDDMPEVRLTCLDQLEKQKDPRVTAYFVGRMRDKHASNEVVNRAGEALGRIKDPSCIDSLIEFLVTTQIEEVQPPGGPGAMSTTFNKKGGGGGGLGMNQKPTLVRREMQNAGVLGALTAITGQNFGYDQRAWATWYTRQKANGAPVEATKQGAG